MRPLQAEQAAFYLQLKLPEVKNEHRLTKAVIEAIPTGNADYRPDPNSKTAVELAWHMAATEHRFTAGVATGAFDFNPIPRPEGGLTPLTIANWYGKAFLEDFETLTKMTPEACAREMDFRGIVQMSAVLFLDFMIKHSVHHRGQLSAYLRASGGKVPSIYGESYDSAEAKKAAGQS